MIFADYHQAIAALLTEREIEETGWGRHFAPMAGYCASGRPQSDSVIELDARGLSRQYVCGYISVDFASRTVTFTEANLHDGCDERLDRQHPNDAWWQAASELDWPLRPPAS